MDINGKKIVLTGASSGIGAEILQHLLLYDVDIVVGDINPDNITANNSRIHPVFCDVSKRDHIDRLFDLALETMGKIDIFIANAGFAYYEVIEQEDWERIDKIYQTNTISPIYAAAKMARINKDREYCIVVTASAMAKLPIPGYALYASTKAALDNFAYAYRFEHKSNGHLLLVYPIATKTNFFYAANKSVPVPWPAQQPKTVAKAVINGIKRNKKSIYPSKIFRTMMFLNHILPFLLPIYAKIEHSKLKKWVKTS